MATREELEMRVKLVGEIAQKDASPEIQNASTRAQALLTEFDAATAEARDRIAQTLLDLAQSVSQLVAQRQSQTKTKLEKSWPYIGMGVLALVFFGLAAFGWSYISRIDAKSLTTIEGVRPLLVMAAILSTITFGGALLLGALFSAEGTFDERFRRAREIFLVFSGIFGTVLGFYFGAGESRAPQLGVAAMRSDATIVAFVTGGTSPYKVTVTYGPNKRTKLAETKDGMTSFSFDKATDNIVPSVISVTDSKGLQGTTTVDLNQDDLKKEGWKLPTETPPGATPSPTK